MTELMLIEGMKQLRIIEKKISDNSADIQRYSSMVSSEKPLFETEEKQKKALKSIIQSNKDLTERYLDLKKRIEYTNLFTIVKMETDSYAISDLLVIKRKIANLMINTFNSLNDNEGNGRLRSYGSQTDLSGNRPQIVRFYKEEDKRTGLKVWQDLYYNIITRLEVVNATTPLMSLPSV